MTKGKLEGFKLRPEADAKILNQRAIISMDLM